MFVSLTDANPAGTGSSFVDRGKYRCASCKRPELDVRGLSAEEFAEVGAIETQTAESSADGEVHLKVERAEQSEKRASGASGPERPDGVSLGAGRRPVKIEPKEAAVLGDATPSASKTITSGRSFHVPL